MNIQTETAPKKKYIQTSAFGVPEYELKCEGQHYKPRISQEYLSKLRVLKRSTHKPITELVAEALEMYLTKQKGDENNGPILYHGQQDEKKIFGLEKLATGQTVGMVRQPLI